MKVLVMHAGQNAQDYYRVTEPARAVVAAGAMAGVPLLNGFLSKEMFFTEAVVGTTGVWAWLVPAAVLASTTRAYDGAAAGSLTLPQEA